MGNDRVVSQRVELRAWRYTGDDAQLMPEWVAERVHSAGRMALEITSTQGILTCQRGDWVVQDLNGDIGVSPAEVFARRYQSLSGDANAVQLAMQSTMFQPGHWNPGIVERAAVAFHNNSKDEPGWVPWAAATESDKAATRQGIRKALTAAISPVNRP